MAGFQVGDLVLAKVGTYPPWPAKVVNPSDFKKQDKPGNLFVLFFCPNQVTHCPPDHVFPFAGQHRATAEAFARSESCVAEFKKALAKCQEEAQKRAAQALASEDVVDAEAETEDQDMSAAAHSRDTAPRDQSSGPTPGHGPSSQGRQPASASVQTPGEQGGSSPSEEEGSQPRRSTRVTVKQSPPTAAKPPEDTGTASGRGQALGKRKGAQEENPPPGKQASRKAEGARRKAVSRAEPEEEDEDEEEEAEDAEMADGEAVPEEGSEPEEEGSEDDGEDAEYGAGTKRGKRRVSKQESAPAKRVRPDASAGAPKRGRPVGSGKKAAAKGRQRASSSGGVTDEGEAAALFTNCLDKLTNGSQKQVEAMARKWADLFDSQPSTARGQLLHLLLQLCGGNVVVPVEELCEDFDMDSVVQRQVVASEKGGAADQLGRKGKAGQKKFMDNLAYFLKELIVEGQEALVFSEEGGGIESVLDFATALSCCAPRNFRVASTTVALNLVSCLMELAVSLVEHREVTQRQLAAEQKKSAGTPKGRKAKGGGGSSAAQLEDLRRRVEETHERIAKLENLMRKGFNGVVVHRYRDIYPSIREQCQVALGSWISGYPSLFLGDKFSKYLAWMANDKVASVRLAAVEAITALFEKEDNIPSLSQFTDRFVPRFLQMAGDADEGVAVAALSLLQVQLGHKLVAPAAILQLSDLVVSDCRPIREAAAALLYDAHAMLKAAERDPSPEPAGKSKKGGKGGKDKSPGKGEGGAEQQLLCAAQILLPYVDNEILCTQVVEALWDTLPALQEWETLCSMLQAAESRAAGAGALQRKACAQLLACAASKAVGELLQHPPVAQKANQAKKDKLHQEAHTEMTCAVLPFLPELLENLSDDDAVQGLLLGVARKLDLATLEIQQEGQAFSSLVASAKGVLLRSVSGPTLREAAQTLSHFITNASSSFSQPARGAVRETVTKVLQSVREAAVEAEAAVTNPSEGECDAVGVGVALQRLHALLSVSDWRDFLGESDAAEGEGEGEGGRQADESTCAGDSKILMRSLRQLFQAALNLGFLKTATTALECMHLLLLWRIVALRDAPPEDQGRLATRLRAVAAEHRSAVGSSIHELLRKLLEAEVPLAPNKTDFESDAALYETSVKVLQLSADFFTMLKPKQVQGTPLSSLGTPLEDRTLRVYWRVTERVLALDSGAGAGAGDAGALPTEAAAALALSRKLKEQVLEAAAHLVSLGAADHTSLTAAVLSHYEGHEDGMFPAVKRLMQGLLFVMRKRLAPAKGQGGAPAPDADAAAADAAQKPGSIFIGSIKMLYARRRRVLSGLGESQEVEEEQVIQPCHELAKKFFHTLSGLSKAALRPLVWEAALKGVEYAFRDPAANMLFLTAGVLPFTTKLLPEDADRLLEVLCENADNAGVDGDVLKPCDALIETLRERCGPDAGPKASPAPKAAPGTAGRGNRRATRGAAKAPEATEEQHQPSGLKRKKLSFRSAGRAEEEEEEEEEEREEEAGGAGGGTYPLVADTGDGEEAATPAVGVPRGGTPAWATTRGANGNVVAPDGGAGRSYSRRRKVAPPAAAPEPEEEEEEEVEEEEQEEEVEREEEEEEAEQEEEEQEAAVVRGSQRAGTRASSRRAVADTQGSEDLPVLKKRPARGSERVAPALESVDQEKDDEGEEEEDEECWEADIEDEGGAAGEESEADPEDSSMGLRPDGEPGGKRRRGEGVSESQRQDTQRSGRSRSLTASEEQLPKRR